MNELRIFVFEDGLFCWGAVVIAHTEDEARQQLIDRNILLGSTQVFSYPISTGFVGEWGGNG